MAIITGPIEGRFNDDGGPQRAKGEMWSISSKPSSWDGVRWGQSESLAAASVQKVTH